MADAPDMLTLRHHRDLVGRERNPWTRRVLLVLVTALIVAGLVNVFGQRPATSRVEANAASLKVYAPAHLRGGLLFMARFTVVAKRDLQRATLVLDPGWLESMTLNTIEPSPVGEASRNGRLALDFGHLPAGRSLLVFIEFQVNPTNVGHRSQSVALYDGARPIAGVKRNVTIFP
jgi:hypothetical protein